MLVWSTNAYFLFGNSLKYFSLLIGFLSIVWGGVKIKKPNRFYNFFGISICLYILYLLLAHLNHQKTLESQNILFSVVCYVLLLVGYLYGCSKISTVYLKNRYKLLFSILVILGSLAFYLNQTAYLISSSEGMRDLGDENLNPVGLAYSHSLLVIFLFWIFEQTNNRIVKGVVCLSIFSAFMVVISTLSRGAIVFLIIFFIIFYFRGIKLNSRILLSGLKGLIGLVVLFTAVFFMTKENEFIQLKFEALSHRFETLFGYTSSNVEDLSAVAREDVYVYFFNNLSEFTLGQYNYSYYPHNQFLEILMRWGLFGLPLLFFSLIVFKKGVKYFKKDFLKKNPVFFLVVSLFLFSYLQSMTSMNLEMNRMLWFGFGFIFSFKIKDE